MIKFLDFNKEINPDDLPIYIPLYNKIPRKKSERLIAKEMGKLMMTDPHVEVGFFPPEDVVVFHIHDTLSLQL